jgi:lysozyme
MLTRIPSFALLVVFLVACGVLFLAIACAGVDRHPCDWQPDQGGAGRGPSRPRRGARRLRLGRVGRRLAGKLGDERGPVVKLSPAGLERIKRYEGHSLVVYDDTAGLPTIGYGHLLAERNPKTRELQPVSVEARRILERGSITQTEADELLEDDVAVTVDAVNAGLNVQVSQAAFDSLVSFAFNIGLFAFGRSSVLRAVNAGSAPATIRAYFLLWSKVHDPKTGQMVASQGLLERRADEAKAFA